MNTVSPDGIRPSSVRTGTFTTARSRPPPYSGACSPSCALPSASPTNLRILGAATARLTTNPALPLSFDSAYGNNRMLAPRAASRANRLRMGSSLEGVGSKDHTRCPACAYAIASEPSRAPTSTIRFGGSAFSLRISESGVPPPLRSGHQPSVCAFGRSHGSLIVPRGPG